MLEPHEIILKLRDRNLKEVSRQTGVSYIALTNFVRGRTETPTYPFIKALSDYLTDKE
jgi:hypothetical protein